MDDLDYDEYRQLLEGAAKMCRCCSCCRDMPCAGALAGGLCDGFECAHEDESHEAADEEDDLDCFWSAP